MASLQFDPQELKAALARGVHGQVEVQVHHQRNPASGPDALQVTLKSPDETWRIDAAPEEPHNHHRLTADEFARYVLKRAPRDMVSGGR